MNWKNRLPYKIFSVNHIAIGTKVFIYLFPDLNIKRMYDLYLKWNEMKWIEK